MNLKKVLLNNVGLKLLALVLAFVTWFYIGEAAKIAPQKTVLQTIFSSSHYVSKKLSVRPIFVGNLPMGYEFAETEAGVAPEFIVVLGPSDILSEEEFIHTKPIDLSEHTKARTLAVELESISPAIRLEETSVQVYLPIKKVGKKTEE